MDYKTILASMVSTPLGNYIVPGLTSSVLSDGKVRMFDMERNQTSLITPHSHRFDLACLVVEGWVQNTTWTEGPEGDEFESLQMAYLNKPGAYKAVHQERVYMKPTNRTYSPGMWYAMPAEEIHSICFGKGTKVLVFEGPQKRTFNEVLEPVVAGKMIGTMKVEPWMFSK